MTICYVHRLIGSKYWKCWAGRVSRNTSSGSKYRKIRHAQQIILCKLGDRQAVNVFGTNFHVPSNVIAGSLRQTSRVSEQTDHIERFQALNLLFKVIKLVSSGIDGIIFFNGFQSRLGNRYSCDEVVEVICITWSSRRLCYRHSSGVQTFWGNREVASVRE